MFFIFGLLVEGLELRKVRTIHQTSPAEARRKIIFM